MLNKSRFSFVLSTLGHLKRSFAGDRIQNISCMHRPIPGRSERCSTVGNLLTPHEAVTKTCVRNLQFDFRPKYLSAKVNTDTESNPEPDNTDTNGEESERSENDKSGVEDGRTEWDCERIDDYSDWWTSPPANDCFDKDHPEVNSDEGIRYCNMTEVLRSDFRHHLREMEIDQFHFFQSFAFQTLCEGKDFLLNARNGYGKTLLYSIFFVNKLLETAGKEPARTPQLLILAPSMEVAWEIMDVVELVANKKLTVACVHDGVHQSIQETKILAGVDILIGTPDHLQDLHYNRILSLHDLRHVVFDGLDYKRDDPTFPDFIYQDQTERKIHTVVVLCQSLLPPWVTHLQKNCLPSAPSVWNERFKKMEKQHNLEGVNIYNWWPEVNYNSKKYAIECKFSNRDAMVASLLELNCGQTIIFGQTKEDVDRLLLNGDIGQQLAVLHPDMPLEIKKKIIKNFKDGRIKCLATTEESPHVAELPRVPLVVHLGPERDCVNYARRLNQATDHGSSVTLYHPLDFDFIKQRMFDIVGIKTIDYFRLFKIYSEHQPEIHTAMATISSRSVSGVSKSVAKDFVEAAKELIEQYGPLSAVSTALSIAAGRVNHEAETEAQEEMRAINAVFAHQEYHAFLSQRISLGDDEE